MPHQPLSLFLERLPTPIGALLIVTDCEDQVRAIDWHDCEERLHRLLRAHVADPAFRLDTRDRSSQPCEAIEGLAVKTGGTDFQRALWLALRSIPCGTSTSYSALARKIGRPAAVRAVGLANARNPVNLAVPCHRVVGANGSLTGYAGGLHRKQWLLKHESTAREPKPL